ncbi:hypothetical protein BIV57_22610 [Mangrovactinospora gilvigrisea]|uniref:Uncharacterized protein n=1 Tax=Mangrovactinospora gilvigrisea TaxID=1428644 RepID=A0A1J7B9H5_9ACTN|nr:hypothetical protein [Mangrovactinospora gilvigrisea]OIV35245.1 hypothetical protein BIV57_22610 [Mangrovactinospora gilvigrisea]
MVVDCESMRSWWSVTVRGNRALLVGLAQEEADKAVERLGDAAWRVVAVGRLLERLRESVRDG